MEKVKEMNYDDMMVMKEKRRTSRSKGKRIYEKTKIHSARSKRKNVKHMTYDPGIDYDLLDFEDDY